MQVRIGRSVTARLAIAVVALALSSADAVAAPVTRLRVASPFDEVTTSAAHVGSTYNLGVGMWVRGPGEVRVLSARALRTTPGLDQLDPVIAWGCDGKEWFVGAVGADLRGRRNTDIRTWDTVRIRSEHESCYYLLLRFVPTARGHFHVREGEVVYRVGGRTFTQRFPFRHALLVTRTGPDPRE